MNTETVVIWPGEPEWKLVDLLPELRSRLEARVEAAYLIGSYAAETAGSASDIDLILVKRTTLPWPERGELFPDLFQAFRNVDLFVYTPEEWKALEEDPSPFIIHVSENWKKII